MLVLRAYNVLENIAVEVSCVHEGDIPSSHLLIREERRPGGQDLAAHLRAVEEVVSLLRWLPMDDACSRTN